MRHTCYVHRQYIQSVYEHCCDVSPGRVQCTHMFIAGAELIPLNNAMQHWPQLPAGLRNLCNLGAYSNKNTSSVISQFLSEFRKLYIASKQVVEEDVIDVLVHKHRKHKFRRSCINIMPWLIAIRQLSGLAFALMRRNRWVLIPSKSLRVSLSYLPLVECKTLRFIFLVEVYHQVLFQDVSVVLSRLLYIQIIPVISIPNIDTCRYLLLA